MDKNKVKIELYKSKVMAKFSHYVSGNIYYTVQMEDGNYQFPIETVEYIEIDPQNAREDEEDDTDMILSDDLGTTSFNAEMKASELNRWIGKAISNEEFIKID
jgi:hypothetical protein